MAMATSPPQSQWAHLAVHGGPVPPAPPSPRYPYSAPSSPLPSPSHRMSPFQQLPPSPQSQSPSDSDLRTAQITAALPDWPMLEAARDKALALNDPALIVSWIRDLVFFLERDTDPSRRTSPQMEAMVDEAAAWVMRLTDGVQVPTAAQADAFLIRGDLRASGNIFPRQFRKSLRHAFTDFDRAARGGCLAGWARIGRDYEGLKDYAHARVAYEQGLALGPEVACEYRIAMACLQGQLGVAQDQQRALQLLRHAATRATLQVPEPAYVYGMVLVQEFNGLTVPPELLQASVAEGSSGAPPRSLEAEAAYFLAQAAYLHCAQAQLKLGWAYENAQLEMPYDPLMSVQYYSLASQAGLAEADMALSKWFLCGAQGCFDVNETLAYQFAQKAAPTLPSAQFALGYYYEVGVGCSKDVSTAKGWYSKAAEQGNADAHERLRALEGEGAGAQDNSSAQTMSRQNVTTTIQRSRTLAAQRSIARRHKTARAGPDAEASPDAPAAGAAGTASAPAQSPLLPPNQANTEHDGRTRYAPASPSAPQPAFGGPALAVSAPVSPQQQPQQQPQAQQQAPMGYQGFPQEPLRRKQTLSMAQAAAGGRYGPGRGAGGRGRGMRAASGPAAAGAPAESRQGSSASSGGRRAGPASGSESGSAPSDLAPAPPSTGVRYDTFAAMGFEPKKQTKDECVVM